MQGINLKVPTAHGILQTLEHKGYIIRVDKTKYSLGIKCLRLGKNFEVGSVEYNKIHNLLENLVSEVGETCYFEFKIGDYNYLYDNVESKELLRVALIDEKYQKLPYESAVNKLYRSEFTDSQDYVLDIELLYPGLTCMCIPFKNNGKIVASILFTGVSSRFNNNVIVKAYESFKRIMTESGLEKHI